MTIRIDRGAIEAARHGISRSPEWPKVEKAHLAKEPYCAACNPGSNAHAAVQVHHVFPFHYCVALGRPDLELDQRNLITLCETEENRPAEDHHLLVGHLDDFQSANLNAVQDAKTTFHGLSAASIREDQRWKLEEASRLKPLDQMTPEDKAGFKSKMDTLFPKPSGS